MNPEKSFDFQRSQVRAALNVVQAVADAIKELKQVPSCVLYAQLMSHMDLGAYQKVIALLKDAGLVKEENHMLTWVCSTIDKA